MRLTSSQVWAIVGFSALVWLALSVVGFTDGEPSAALSLTDVIPFLIFVGALYERHLWRAQPLHRMGLAGAPVLIGTWRGELRTFWEDPETSEQAPVKTVYVAIRQTALTITVRLLTDESVSEMLAGGLAPAESGYPAVSYTFRNRPDTVLRRSDRSHIHYGAAILEVEGDPAVGLEGDYWTDRPTQGKLRFREHSPKVAQTFAAAQMLSYGPPKPVGVRAGLPVVGDL